MFHRQPNLPKLLAQQEPIIQTLVPPHRLIVLALMQVIMSIQLWVLPNPLKLLAQQEPIIQTPAPHHRLIVSVQMQDIMSIHLWARVNPLKLLAQQGPSIQTLVLHTRIIVALLGLDIMFQRQANLAKLLAQQEHTQQTTTEALPVMMHQRVIMFHQQAKYLKLLAQQEPTKQQQVRVPVTKQMQDIMSIYLWVRVKPLKLLA
tara:strand:- start:465 stop:1073 length:609 start_codon:yes stop_codon:yes gene_type:complete